jgi:membrane protein implicated in regulation of membrane protease activity
MANSTVWWLLAGAAVALELLSGTVYLLLIGIAFAAAALSAHLGFVVTLQLLVAAIVGVGAVLAWYLTHRGAPVVPSEANRDLNLDVGENVHVEAWNADGTAVVRHRGAQWTVVVRPGVLPVAGLHRIIEVVGNRLVVEKI